MGGIWKNAAELDAFCEEEREKIPNTRAQGAEATDKPVCDLTRWEQSWNTTLSTHKLAASATFIVNRWCHTHTRCFCNAPYCFEDWGFLLKQDKQKYSLIKPRRGIVQNIKVRAKNTKGHHHCCSESPAAHVIFLLRWLTFVTETLFEVTPFRGESLWSGAISRRRKSEGERNSFRT